MRILKREKIGPLTAAKYFQKQLIDFKISELNDQIESYRLQNIDNNLRYLKNILNFKTPKNFNDLAKKIMAHLKIPLHECEYLIILRKNITAQFLKHEYSKIEDAVLKDVLGLLN